MTIKVIGAGLPRCGSVSMKAALEILGFDKCYQMKELAYNPEQIEFWEVAACGKTVAWDVLFKNYQSTIGYPGVCFYKQLMKQYPDAKVILNIRDTDSWYRSVINTIHAFAEEKHYKWRPPYSRRQEYIMREFRVADKVLWEDRRKHGRP